RARVRRSPRAGSRGVPAARWPEYATERGQLPAPLLALGLAEVDDEADEQCEGQNKFSEYLHTGEPVGDKSLLLACEVVGVYSDGDQRERGKEQHDAVEQVLASGVLVLALGHLYVVQHLAGVLDQLVMHVDVAGRSEPGEVGAILLCLRDQVELG